MFNPFKPHIIKYTLDNRYQIRKLTLSGWAYLFIDVQLPTYTWTESVLLGGEYVTLKEAEKDYALISTKKESKPYFIKYL